MMSPALSLPRVSACLLALVLTAEWHALAVAQDFEKEIRPLLAEYCNKCHSTEKQKGDLDLERFTSFDVVKRDPHVWQLVDEQIALGEMPPKDKPQPSPEQKAQLTAWVSATLDALARERAGDPGPVVLRRLSNAELASTVRDLTGVASLDPAREFPVDGAAGEGFTNTGAALVMSPALFTKYLDAAKDIASHAVLLPGGIAFSPSTSPRDWTEEKLAAIRGVYREYTDNGGGTAVNLQGIRFDTKDGGVLPLDRYLNALLDERAGTRSSGEIPQGLSAKYLATLREMLAGKAPNFLLDPIRAQWATAKPGDGGKLAKEISRWQHALWKFNSVGHIGKKNGPKSWMEPLTPMQDRQELRLKMPPPANAREMTLYLAASDAGDGNAGDAVVWEQPRFLVPGQPPLLLRDVREVYRALSARRARTLSQTAKHLAAAAEVEAGQTNLAALAQKQGIEEDALAAWLAYLGLNSTGPVKLEGYFTETYKGASGYDFISGWEKSATPNLAANSSDQHVRIPGNMKPHSVAIHPAPKVAAIIGWRSPAAARVRVTAAIQHAHPECGNGVTWSLELRRGSKRQRLANGIAQGAKAVAPAPIENLQVQPGDVLSMLIGARDANHSCDLTAVDLTITSAGENGREWDLAKDVSPNVTAGNPHADRFGNEGVWHFYTEPDKGAALEPVIPAGSLLAKWQASSNAEERAALAGAIEQLLTSAASGKDSPDAALHRQLTSLGGPLFHSLARSRANAAASNAADEFALDAAQFKDGNLAVQAPSVVEVRLPLDLVGGFEFVTTGVLDKTAGAEGSVQLQLLTKKPEANSGLLAIEAKTADGEGPWYSNNRVTSHDAPIVANPGSAARQRIEAAFDEFRQMFPAALCYTKIVPVDEVVTLTLFYREDEHFKRLMLDDAAAARLDRLWDELRYVSQDALKLVDVFAQLWQYATQDADPSVFEPMREPIRKRAAEFQQRLVDTQPAQLDGVLEFAQRAWRRPLTDAEREELRALYRKLRADELPHDAALRMTLARVFVAPAFLYKLERPAPGIAQAPVNDWELAARLSYFLWSSAPDEELRALAAAGKLRDPQTLAAQTRRMLRDARVRRLAVEFGTQWLHVRDFDKLDEKSERHFPTFAALRGAMNEEPVRFFTDFFQRDASVVALLDADYTFVNGALAKHYGFTAKGDDWQRVDGIRAQGRGGVLAFAATLAKQSGASRTSPILRGNWLCETILGERLPRPPKGVPVLPEEAPAGLTDRQLTEQHSSDPKCAGCHARIDPFGFAFERYDAIGALRATADTRARLADGTEFDGLDGVRDYLLTKRRDAFVKQFTRKLLGYALGRSVQLSDMPLVEDITARIATGDPRIGSVVEAIVQSRQFREIRGRDFAQE